MSKKSICVDVDGVLAQYNTWKGVRHIGTPIPGAKEFLEALSEEFEVVIYTTRMNPELNWKEVMDCDYTPTLENECIERLKNILKGWLSSNCLKYDSIWTGRGKPICVAFIDDRAINSVTLFVSCDSEGNEGIVAMFSPKFGWMPMIAADEARLDSLRERAAEIAQEQKLVIREVKFTFKTIVQEFIPTVGVTNE